MLSIVQCMRTILYTRCFGSWLYCRLQVIGCHTDTFSPPVFLVTAVGIEPGNFRILDQYATTGDLLINVRVC
jgi:thiamine monophosphate kinase